MKDLKILLYLDFLKIKNGLLDAIHNPLIFLKRFGPAIFFLVFFLIFSGNYSNADNSSNITFTISNIVYTQVLGGIAIFASILILGVFSFYLCDYTPKNFTLSDIQYLFPSPLNNKIILFYSMVKSAIKGVGMFFLSIIFLIVILVSKTNISLVGLIPVAIGFFFILLFFISLSYLLFAIKVKTGLEKELKLISRIFTGLLFILISYYIYKLYTYGFDISLFLKDIGSSYLISIPIISSISKFSSLILMQTLVPPILDLIFLLSLIILNSYIFTILNVDYYEDIANSVADLNEKIKVAKASRGFNYNTQVENKIKKVNIGISSKERTGVMALYWKCSVARKRRQTSIKKYLVFALNIAISIGGAYATLKGYQLIALVSISVSTLYGVLIFTAASELPRELKNLYIYLIPGSPIAKIFATLLDEILLLVIRITIMFVPSIVLRHEYLILGIGIYIITILTTFVLRMQNLVMILLLPREEDVGPGMLSILFSMIIVMVPVGITVLTYSITTNPYIAFGALTIVISIYFGLLMLLCNTLFNKIEY
ncbi:putative ABC exporter domain-containing protein [Clostridium gasigenes]|uniref:putative ABC exporter domain-containing protein n=1 Tax=Clostridium gasigenes TaxID=94869 RepID=UPI001C0DB1CB|nr:putative ABC exporter domain-containing protein [Clostridium gasigenes]MBU3106675.1 putative ABC exporter domain-containing protein [Clostridium gasigenes]